MRIDNNDIGGTSAVRTTAADLQARARTTSQQESHSLRTDDSVETSQISAAAAGDPAKVERLREAYLSGNYRVDPHKVAASIVNEHLDK